MVDLACIGQLCSRIFLRRAAPDRLGDPLAGALSNSNRASANKQLPSDEIH
jgi:hypothetical protein